MEKVTDGLSNYSLILIDEYLNLKKDLRKGKYHFELSKPGKYNDRFKLFLSKDHSLEDETTVQLSKSDDLFWRIFDNALWLSTLSERNIASVEV